MTKYVTQGERDMVEAVVSGMTGLSSGEGVELVSAGDSCFSIRRHGRARFDVCATESSDETWGDATFIFRTNDGSAAASSWRFAGPVFVDGGPGGSDLGDRAASRVWVQQQISELPQHKPRVFESDWLVSSDTVVGSVLFENVGEREFEYQPRDGAQVTFYPRTSTQNLPMPWSTIQQRIVGYGTIGPKIQVRCIADDGTKTPFVAVVTNEAP